MATKSHAPKSTGNAAPATASEAPAPGFSTPPGLGNAGFAEQMGPSGGGEDGSGLLEDVAGAAEAGTAGGGGALPHLDAIQKSFGSHDVAGVSAHTGGDARDASRAMGAEAYATGNHVALGGDKDLHTVAHEAAHVVQQRAGKGPAGGVGEAGDAFEAHADAVADAVVAGKSAEPILDEMAGEGGSASKSVQKKAVQALHGDLGAAVNPDIAAKKPDMAGKTVGEAGAALSERDANFNPKRKVEFESQLTAAILADPGPALGVVNAVSRNMLAYFEAKKEAGLGSADADLAKLGANFASLGGQANTVFFGRLADETKNLKGDIASEMRKLLMGGGTIPQQIFAHHQFIDQIWDAGGKGDFSNGVVAKITEVAQRHGQTFTALAPKSFRKDAAGGERKEFAERGRFTPKEAGSRVSQTFGSTSVPSTGDAMGLRARDTTGTAADGKGATQSAAKNAGTSALTPAEGGGQEHQRGVDRLTMDESNAFVQEARLILDMPLGGGISGTTTDLLEVATILGCPDKHLYAIGVLGHLGSAGAHSFHEIAKAASFAGIPYKDGDYASFIPAAYMPKVAHLFKEFADVVNTSGAPKVAAATADPAAKVA